MNILRGWAEEVIVFDPKGKTCPACKRKGLHFSDHPHFLSVKDYGSVTCRFCHKRFKIRNRINENTEQPLNREENRMND